LLHQDGSKIFTASCDKSAKMWDLASNQFVQVAQVHVKSLLLHIFVCIGITFTPLLQFLIVQNQYFELVNIALAAQL